MADPVNFVRPAAERIARVVRSVEFGNRDGTPLEYDQPPGDAVGGLRLRLGRFTGNWQTATYTTVTLHGSTQTASVYNWCNPALGGDTASSASSRYVIFGSVKGTQSAVEIQMRTTECQSTLTLGTVDLTTLPGYVAGQIQLLGHEALTGENTCSGGLQWYSITTCSTATAA